MKKTNTVKVGNLFIGGGNKIVIQSMTNTKTKNIIETVNQIKKLEKSGCELVRVAVLDESDAYSLKEIKQQINIPLVADIHFDYRLALISLDMGIDKLRINPGNIGSIEKIKIVVEKCKEKKIPIRIGVNSGSVDKSLSTDGKHTAQLLVESAGKHIKILEDLGFTDIILSIKSSNVKETIEANRLAAKIFPYPLHLGLTEAGNKDYSLIRSSAALSTLLLEGIGNTIRISITGDPKDEIYSAKKLLHDLDLYPNYPTLISCPTCGRTQVNLEKLVKEISDYLETKNKNITVAIMGCVVNGPGEAKNADIGLAGGKSCYAIFKKGIVTRTVSENDAYNELIKEIDKL